MSWILPNGGLCHPFPGQEELSGQLRQQQPLVTATTTFQPEPLEIVVHYRNGYPVLVRLSKPLLTPDEWEQVRHFVIPEPEIRPPKP